MSKIRALRLLDHACAGGDGAVVCMRVVEAQGLRTVFGWFMKSSEKSPDSSRRKAVEHLLGIFASLLRSLPSDSAPRIRTLAKFVERNYEKVEKLLDLREEYIRGVKAVEKNIKEQKSLMDAGEEDEESFLERRLEGGLFCLQLIDQILAWLCAEDDGARRKIPVVMKKRGMGIKEVGVTIKGKSLWGGCGGLSWFTDLWG